MPTMAPTSSSTKIRSKWRKKNSLARSTGRGCTAANLTVEGGAATKVEDRSAGAIARGSQPLGPGAVLSVPVGVTVRTQLLVAGAFAHGEGRVTHEARVGFRARAPKEGRAPPVGRRPRPAAGEAEADGFGALSHQ